MTHRLEDEPCWVRRSRFRHRGYLLLATGLSLHGTGQLHLTLVYQIDGHCKRLLWVGRERKAATLEGFFDWFGAARSAALYFVCSDMWKPYLKVVAERAGQAVQVLDRFHIMSHFSKAIDEVRAAEVRKLAAAGKAPVLKHSRWLLLKRPENLTDGQAERLAELVRRNLRTVSRLPAQGGLPAAVGLRVAVLGRTVPRPLVHSDDALAARTDEGRCPHGALAPRPDPELVPSPGAVLQRRRRRLQREGQSDHQTGVWVPHLRSTGSRFVSRTWRPARTRTHPQILLTRQLILLLVGERERCQWASAWHWQSPLLEACQLQCLFAVQCTRLLERAPSSQMSQVWDQPVSRQSCPP